LAAARRAIDANPAAHRGYLLKEQLRRILRHPWRYLGVMRAPAWWILVVFDRSAEFRTVALQLARHLDAVIAGREFDMPLGLAESPNSQIAALRFPGPRLPRAAAAALKTSGARAAAQPWPGSS
jgi:hypothetical protein